jgi:hypothetical protein
VQFIYTDPQTEYERLIGGFHCINAFGKVEAGDDEKFRNFLEVAAPPPRTTVYLDSSGGDVEAAMGIARLIRSGWYETSIGRYHLNTTAPRDHIVERELLQGQCLSAATLVYLGGRLRHFPDGAEFGVHQFSFKNPSPANLAQSQLLSAKMARFMGEMGIQLEFMEIASSTSGEKINRLNIEDLKKLKVVTGGITDVNWTVQAKNNMIYVRGERDSIFGHHKVMLGYIKGHGLYFWAVIEAQGREGELTTFGLVEIVVNGEAIRIDVTDRCERAVSGSYVNILVKLTTEEAGLVALSDSFGVQIRFSSDAGMFLGVSAMSTVGGREQLATLLACFNEDHLH